jgi:hypothetical protein
MNKPKLAPQISRMCLVGEEVLDRLHATADIMPVPSFQAG